mmetsp:Transcript_22188/g.51237  ORF Transcript_22188/g.51237 Transcript_22188/m.51237 type:complete len:287 (+) Transcript_22188:168-1028(+)
MTDDGWRPVVGREGGAWAWAAGGGGANSTPRALPPSHHTTTPTTPTTSTTGTHLRTRSADRTRKWRAYGVAPGGGGGGWLAAAASAAAAAGAAGWGFLLCCMCAFTSSFAARAESNESSPAMTAAATMRPNFCALSPGFFGAREAPLTPIISRHCAWAGSEVPPPTVPTSIEGIEHEICRSGPPSPSESIASRSVMQFELSITCAGSWPVARKTAATMLAACALLPPTLPAMAEPTRFLRIATSTNAGTLVLRVFLTTALGMTASTTTDLPLPSIQFTAAGFLSAQ